MGLDIPVDTGRSHAIGYLFSTRTTPLIYGPWQSGPGDSTARLKALWQDARLWFSVGTHEEDSPSPFDLVA